MTIAVHDNPQRQRFEAAVGDALAVASYRVDGRTMVFTHTEVPEAARGQGIGGQLVRAGLQAARARGLVVEPRCPMVAAWMRTHPESHDLLSPEGKALVDSPA